MLKWFCLIPILTASCLAPEVQVGPGATGSEADKGAGKVLDSAAGVLDDLHWYIIIFVLLTMILDLNRRRRKHLIALNGKAKAAPAPTPKTKKRKR